MNREHPPSSSSEPVLSEASAPPDLRRIFEHYYATVLTFFLHRGFDRDDALDLTQETFLRVYRNMGSLRNVDSLPAWLRRIAVNVWRNEIRRLKSGKRFAVEVRIGGADAGDDGGGLVEEQIAANGPLPLDDALKSEAGVLLRHALSDLPAQMRRCLQLHVDQDLKYSEIATIMKIKINTVKSQIHQARQRLKAQIGRSGSATTET